MRLAAVVLAVTAIGTAARGSDDHSRQCGRCPETIALLVENTWRAQ